MVFDRQSAEMAGPGIDRRRLEVEFNKALTRQATLNEILDSRERRAAKQKELLSRYGTPLVSYTMNIPGAEKDSPLIRAGFLPGLRRLLSLITDRELSFADFAEFRSDPEQHTENAPNMSSEHAAPGRSSLIKHCEIHYFVTGPEAYLCVDMDPRELKKITVSLEEADPLGRLFDMDVLAPEKYVSEKAASGANASGKAAPGANASGETASGASVSGREVSPWVSISRSALGLPMRKCLLCGEPAKACRRSGTHTPEELHKAVFSILSEALGEELADLACAALRAELDATPKPGLVDRYNSGSHKDMNYSTFCRSIESLRPYFAAAARLGMRYPGFPAPDETADAATGTGISSSISTSPAAAGAAAMAGTSAAAPTAVSAAYRASDAGADAGKPQTMAAGSAMNSSAKPAVYNDTGSSYASSTVAPGRTFQKLRALGKAAEADMLAATGGVNTHKGAVFSMGLAVCAAARVLSGTAPGGTFGAGIPSEISVSDGIGALAERILDECARLTNGLCARDFAGVTAENAATAGEKLFVRFGIKGIRGQAEEGYPAVRFAGLPVYESVLRAFAPAEASAAVSAPAPAHEHSVPAAASAPASAHELPVPAAAFETSAITKNAAACTALLAILCHSADTNLIKRGGLEKAEEVTGRIRSLLYGETTAGHFGSNTAAEEKRPGSIPAEPAAQLHVPTESELLLLDMDFIRNELSPGGSADLLALTIFLSDLGRRFGIAESDADPSAETVAGSKTGTFAETDPRNNIM